MKYNLEWVKSLSQVEYLFFWGHQPSRDGSIIKTCMSQWWNSMFEEKSVLYKTAEHYMMAQKALLFNDLETFERIISKESPKDVKDLGRQIKQFDSEIWDKNKYQIVRQGNYLKFSQNEKLKNFLTQTKDKIIAEASPVDTIWGIGLKEDSPQILNPNNWRGENLLGFALMEVRDELNKKTTQNL
jgi:ribA/ribD-fused uncharacterized protein